MYKLLISELLAVVVVLVGVNPVWAGPTWRIAELPGLAGADWGEVAAEAGHSYRVVRAGRQAAWTVPVWWGDGFRPAEGVIYNLRVHYKDTVTTPAIFYSHAGVSSYFRFSEVHRFGGRGDGTWKTADIPVSWDLVCRKNLLGEVTEFAIAAEGDLPVESIQVMPVAADADRTYFRQTRQWVVRAQADKRGLADGGPRQQPMIPPAMTGQPLVAYARNYLAVVYPNSAPQAGEAGATLKLRMARNEYEPAAFGVYANGRALKNVTFTVGPMTGPKGELQAAIDLRTAEYSVVQAGKTKGKYRLFPQRLWPAYPVDIAAGQSHWLWITVHTLGARSQPGTYTGTVRITAEGAEGNLPIEVEVLPIRLLTMNEAGLSLGTCLSGLCTQQELKTLAEHNHTGMDLWFGGARPEMKVVGGKLSLDFAYMDDWMAYARKCGMTHVMWFLGGNPYGFPDTMNIERDLYRASATTNEENHRLRAEYIKKAAANPNKVIPELTALYTEWVRQVAAHGKANDWPLLILHPFDEPAKWVQDHVWSDKFPGVIGTGPWIKDHFKDACALIRKASKQVLVGGDIHHAEPGIVFVKDIDVFCTNAIHEDLQLGDKVRAAGTQFWQYSGCNDQTAAHRPRYTFGFYFAAFDSRGSLVWAYNCLDRFDTSEGDGWGYGWYTPFGTIVTPFMAGLREGWDDRRWVETYKARVVAKDAKAKKLLDRIGAEAIAMRAPGGRDTVSDFYAEIKRYEKLDRWRGQLIDAILRAAQ